MRMMILIIMTTNYVDDDGDDDSDDDDDYFDDVDYDDDEDDYASLGKNFLENFASVSDKPLRATRRNSLQRLGGQGKRPR